MSDKDKAKVVCRRCGRGLKNPKWQALGLGPVCAKKEGI